MSSLLASISLSILLLSTLSHAQSNVAGLGTYRIGVTTPDSLDRIAFEEGPQSYVKGTLTLPCTHIRTFNSPAVEMAGILITNLSLTFYDNTLFHISCDYSDELKDAFLSTYGKGISKPVSRLVLCDKGTDKAISLWGEAWQNADIVALVVHTKGYNSDCQMEEAVRLIIVSQRFSALSAECELKNTNPFIEEFGNVLNNQQPSQQRMLQRSKP